MIIGTFSYDSQNDSYEGEITTLTFQRSNVLLRPIEKQSDKEPDYRVVQENDGRVVEFGAAWKRTSEKRRDFLSVSLDDPALASPLNAALFLSDREEGAVLVWQRNNKKAPSAETEPATPRSRRTTAARAPRAG